MAKGLELDFETADRITVLTLKEQRAYLVKEVNDHERKGSYMHPEDYHASMTRLIPALEVLIPYFGGSL